MPLPARAPDFLAADADRELAAGVLRAAWVEGRLTVGELDSRLAAVFAARTLHDLDEALVGLPRAAPARPLLASWWRRSCALLLDHVLLGFGILAGIAAGVEHWGAAGIAFVLLAPVACVAYFTLAHGSRSGRTVGERVCGIAVRADPDWARALRRATYGQAFGRVLMLYVFLALGVFGALNFLWPLWDHKRQAWHDKVAGTIVIRVHARAFDRHRWLRRLRRR